ncbi:MAG: hypothetical protein A2Y25_00690 [Candidatus Melainabacteria bacterium GWF2_37_15]|nr:MAG: hypothetical protein A2Y25_00690 [Candidatus Melainabacteria bacterium GWF2_37_15]
MKKSIKTLTLTGLSGIMLATTVLPAFAQDYSYSNYGYNSQQTPQYQNQNYQQGYQQSYQQQNYVPVQNNYSLPPLQGRVVSVPPGTMLPGVTATRKLSSQNLRTGDSINVVMNTPFYYAGAMVLPAGTSILGTVVTAKPAGRAEANGQLMIVFNQAITPSGQRIGLTGKLATEDGSGLLKGGTGMSRATAVVKDTAVGAGSGALLGLIFGALSGGKAGRGAALGTAVGGGAGAVKTIIDKGNEVVINAGDQLDIILDSELRTGGEETSNPAPSNYNSNYNYGY